MNTVIPLLFFAFIIVTILPLIMGHEVIKWWIQKKRIKKGEIKEYTIVERLPSHAMTEAEKLIGVTTIDYIVSDEHGNRYPINLYHEYENGHQEMLRKKKDGTLEVIMRNEPEPYAWIALICGFVLTIANIILIIYSFKNENAFENWWQILVFILGLAAVIAGIYILDDNMSIYDEKNAVNAKVVGYGWEKKTGVAGQGETQRTRRYYMYVKAMIHDKYSCGIGAEVYEGGKIERKYPIGSTIKMYYRWRSAAAGYESRIQEQKYQAVLQGLLPIFIGIVFIGFGIVAWRMF